NPVARALLADIATRAVPIIAVIFLLQLSVLALLSRSRLRNVASMLGVAILAALLLGTSLLAYAAMKTDEISAAYQSDRTEELFGQRCATCHRHARDFENKKPSASDLADFGTLEWIAGLLHRPESPQYFGNTKLRAMSNWIKKTRAQAVKDNGEAKLNEDFGL